jgi:2-polyprenyl-3-methyl-5-hydroxy-6-metoxy-1,4-benzoquinol methylase
MSTSRYAREVDLTDLNNAHTLGILAVPPGSRVLDIGAASGSVARGLVERDCKVWAVEIDPESARAAEPMCEQVVVADVEKLDIASAFDGVEFDAVLLLDVLEHLRDPLAVLRKCAAMVGGGGRLVMSIPNVAHAAVRLALLSGRFRYTERGLLDETHLRFFDRAAADQLLVDAELTVIEDLRTTAGLTETEIPIEPGSFPPEVIAEATRDPDSETYQFIFVATPRRDGAALAGSLALELQRRVEELERMIRELETERRDIDFLEQDLRLKETYLIDLRAKLAEGAARERELEKDVRVYRAALAGVEHSFSWRITAPLRRLKARAGGRNVDSRT